MRSAYEIARALTYGFCPNYPCCSDGGLDHSCPCQERVLIAEAAQREAIEAAAKALGHLLHRAPDGVYATAVNDCHTAIRALLPAPAKEDSDAKRD